MQKTSVDFRAILQPFIDRGLLAGAVIAVADAQRLLHIDALGFADIARHRPMTPDALFWVASQTKPVTATAIMMLVDDGKLTLDDPIEKYLPQFKDLWLAAEKDENHVLLNRPQSPITFRNLLSNTSGMAFQSAIETPTLDGLPLAVAAASYATKPLESQPGTKYLYSNMGFNTAARALEVVTGQTYADFLQERVFDPLGMRDTTFWPSSEQLSRLATTYKPDPATNELRKVPIHQLRYPLDDASRHPMPAGGLFSTAADMLQFCRIFINGGRVDGRQYISQNSIAEMTRKQTGDAVSENYGLGWRIDERSFGHGGAYSTNMTIIPSQKLITTFLVQHAGFAADGAQSASDFLNAARQRFGGQ